MTRVAHDGRHLWVDVTASTLCVWPDLETGSLQVQPNSPPVGLLSPHKDKPEDADIHSGDVTDSGGGRWRAVSTPQSPPGGRGPATPLPSSCHLFGTWEVLSHFMFM